MKNMRTFRAAVVAASMFMTQHAFAQLVVFDPTNFAQNVITAAKAVKGEIYQNTNILYQYQMMMNDLLQAQNLNPAAWKAAYDQITGDIKKVNALVGTLQGLYGDLNKGGRVGDPGAGFDQPVWKVERAVVLRHEHVVPTERQSRAEPVPDGLEHHAAHKRPRGSPAATAIAAFDVADSAGDR